MVQSRFRAANRLPGSLRESRHLRGFSVPLSSNNRNSIVFHFRWHRWSNSWRNVLWEQPDGKYPIFLAIETLDCSSEGMEGHGTIHGQVDIAILFAGKNNAARFTSVLNVLFAVYVARTRTRVYY